MFDIFSSFSSPEVNAPNSGFWAEIVACMAPGLRITVFTEFDENLDGEMSPKSSKTAKGASLISTEVKFGITGVIFGVIGVKFGVTTKPLEGTQGVWGTPIVSQMKKRY